MYVWVHPKIVEPYRPGVAVRPRRNAEEVEPTREVSSHPSAAARGPGGQAAGVRRKVADAYATPAPPRPRPALTCGDLMSESVAVVSPDETLAAVRRLLTERGVRHLPVVERDGTLAGLVSDRDLLRAAARGDADERAVREVMVPRVLVARPSTSVREAARGMLAERVGCLPVLNAAGELVGIVTRSDILRALEKRAPLDLWV